MPSIVSLRLCGGMFVAMPTAIPVPPLISRLGKDAGNTTGSVSLLVVVGDEIHRVPSRDHREEFRQASVNRASV